MPIHDFTNEELGETISVYVPITAPAAEHQQQTVDGKVYKRVYAAPLAAKDMGTRLGDATPTDFKRLTEKQGLKLGDVWEISAGMSAKRKQRDGLDTVQEAAYAKYERENGEKHPMVRRREQIEAGNKRLEEWGIRVNLPN